MRAVRDSVESGLIDREAQGLLLLLGTYMGSNGYTDGVTLYVGTLTGKRGYAGRESIQRQLRAAQNAGLLIVERGRDRGEIRVPSRYRASIPAALGPRYGLGGVTEAADSAPRIVEQDRQFADPAPRSREQDQHSSSLRMPSRTSTPIHRAGAATPMGEKPGEAEVRDSIELLVYVSRVLGKDLMRLIAAENEARKSKGEVFGNAYRFQRALSQIVQARLAEKFARFLTDEAFPAEVENWTSMMWLRTKEFCHAYGIQYKA
jgi:hypothetical protein